MFTKSAAFYDAIYSFKDYAKESNLLHDLIGQYKRSSGNTLLDVGCGTGAHDVFLREHYTITGLDLDSELLQIARERLPDATFHQGDMRNFNLGQQFDVVVCLFSAIGYVQTLAGLNQTIRNLYQHTKPGGVCIIEAWLYPEMVQPGRVAVLQVDTPELKIARMSYMQVEDELSRIQFSYLVGTSDGIQHFIEEHILGLFTHEQYSSAMSKTGFSLNYDAEGISGRGLYIGSRAVE